MQTSQAAKPVSDELTLAMEPGLHAGLADLSDSDLLDVVPPSFDVLEQGVGHASLQVPPHCSGSQGHLCLWHVCRMPMQLATRWHETAAYMVGRPAHSLRTSVNDCAGRAQRIGPASFPSASHCRAESAAYFAAAAVRAAILAARDWSTSGYESQPEHETDEQFLQRLSAAIQQKQQRQSNEVRAAHRSLCGKFFRLWMLGM